MTFFPLLFSSFLACIPAPCAQSCADLGDFFEACADESGTICEGSITFECIDNMESYQECVDNSFDSLSCEQDQGAWQACETSNEAKRSCTRLTQFNYGALKSAAERESYADECAAQDEWSIAVATKDCAKACELAGM